VTAALVVAAVTIPGLIKGSSKPTRVGLVGSSAQALAPTITQTATAVKAKVELSNVADDETARALLTGGKLDVAVSVNRSSARAEVEQTLDPTVRGVIQTSIDSVHLRQSLAAAGLPAAKVHATLAKIPLATTALKPE